MRRVIIGALLGVMISSASWAANNQSDDKVKQQSVNLPGVQKIVKDFDAKVLENATNFQEDKISHLTKAIDDLNKEVVAKCAGQEKLDQSCKDVLIKQAGKQVQLFKNIAEYNNNTAKIMEDKLKYLKKMP